jgi:hypothetical protein
MVCPGRKTAVITAVQHPYKHFYSGAQGGIGEAMKEMEGGLGAGCEWLGGRRLLRGRKLGHSLPAPSPAFGDREGGAYGYLHGDGACRSDLLSPMFSRT